MGQIVVVGSANTDMVLKCAHLPKPGETILGGEFAMAGGGKGANQAVAAARLGGQVTFVARLGRDAMGDQALANYQAEGIACDYITRDDHAASGVALIMVDAAGENLIGVAPGANATLLPEHVRAAEAVFRHAVVLLVQLEIPLETVAAAIQLARKHDVRVIINPAPARTLPSELMQDAVLTPNETEASVLTHQAETELAAQRLIELGARQVVTTLGERGARWTTRAQTQIIPAFPVTAVDTTAAGDAFNGGLAVALSRGDEMLPAIRYASAVAALAVTKLGAQPSLPTSGQVATFLAQHA